MPCWNFKYFAAHERFRGFCHRLVLIHVLLLFSGIHQRCLRDTDKPYVGASFSLFPDTLSPFSARASAVPKASFRGKLSSPIFVVPGLLGSGLFATLPQNVHKHLCCPLTDAAATISDNRLYRVWYSFSALLDEVCWFAVMRFHVCRAASHISAPMPSSSSSFRLEAPNTFSNTLPPSLPAQGDVGRPVAQPPKRRSSTFFDQESVATEIPTCSDSLTSELLHRMGQRLDGHEDVSPRASRESKEQRRRAQDEDIGLSADAPTAYYSPLPGVRLHVDDFGGVHGVRYLDYYSPFTDDDSSSDSTGVFGTRYMADLIDVLKTKLKLVEGRTLFGLPYDWRLPPYQIDWKRVQKLIEASVHMNGGKKAVFVAHSLGTLYLNYFLTEKVTSLWKHKYVSRVVAISSTYGGSVTMLWALLAAFKETLPDQSSQSDRRWQDDGDTASNNQRTSAACLKDNSQRGATSSRHAETSFGVSDDISTSRLTCDSATDCTPQWGREANAKGNERVSRSRLGVSKDAESARQSASYGLPAISRIMRSAQEIATTVGLSGSLEDFPIFQLLPVSQQKLLQHLLRTFGSTYFLLPNSQVYGDDYALVSTDTDMYTPSNISLLFPPRERQLYELTRNGSSEWLTRDPEVPVACVWSLYTSAKTTLAALRYSELTGHNEPHTAPIRVLGEGDGVVGRPSLQTCLRWSQVYSALQVDNLGHLSILFDSEVLAHISELASRPLSAELSRRGVPLASNSALNATNVGRSSAESAARIAVVITVLALLVMLLLKLLVLAHRSYTAYRYLTEDSESLIDPSRQTREPGETTSALALQSDKATTSGDYAFAAGTSVHTNGCQYTLLTAGAGLPLDDPKSFLCAEMKASH